MDQLHVQITGLVEGSADGVLGDLVEHHPLDRHLGVEQLLQVPADALPLPVLVGGQQQLISSLEGLLQLLDNLFLVLGNHIERFELLGRVDAEIGPLLPFVGGRNLAGVVGQVTHMAHRRLDTEILRQVAADGAGLGGALDDDQRVRHRQA